MNGDGWRAEISEGGDGSHTFAAGGDFLSVAVHTRANLAATQHWDWTSDELLIDLLTAVDASLVEESRAHRLIGWTLVGDRLQRRSALVVSSELHGSDGGRSVDVWHARVTLVSARGVHDRVKSASEKTIRHVSDVLAGDGIDGGWLWLNAGS